MTLCFNPRARDGREQPLGEAASADVVSIHAPVMDANIVCMRINQSSLVSIHAPVMDAKRNKVIE